MAIIDPDGLFGGDRLRKCSNLAQLHWPRFFLASDGFGRIEINYAKIVGRAYITFNPLPAHEELFQYVREYVQNFLLFPYQCAGQQWGQWDTKLEYLPRYKTATDRKSPLPDPQAFSVWKKRYISEYRQLPKCFGNLSEGFHADVLGVEEAVVVVEEQILNHNSGSFVSDEWAASDSAIVERFPAADPYIRQQIIQRAVQAHLSASKNGTQLTDAILAHAIDSATTKKQWSPALYLTTLPNFIANQVIQHERSHPK